MATSDFILDLHRHLCHCRSRLLERNLDLDDQRHWTGNDTVIGDISHRTGADTCDEGDEAIKETN